MKKLWKVLKESPLLLAVLLVMFGLLTGGSVQAEEIWEVPVEVKYDITEEHYVFDFTLETEENLYLAYYKGKEVDRESAFETAIFTKSKSVRTNPDYLNCCIMLWVVDGENNIIADAYPQYGGEVLTGATDIYHMCWGTDAKYGFWDQEFGETVEYVNGEQLCDLVATVKNGELIVNLPETESGEQAELKVYAYADDLYVGHGSTYVFLKGGKATINLSWLIEEADEYIFVYWIKGEGIRTRNQYMSYTYEKPEQKVNPVTNLKWDEESTGKFTFTQDNDENISYYEYSLEYKEVGEDSFEKIGGAESRSIFSAWYFYDSDKDIYSYDGAKYYIDENYVYRVAVRALSDNIEIYTHSDWVYSEIYDPFQLIVPTPENQVAAFVNRMYTVALGRETEEEGATWWTEALLAGSSDGAGLAQGFLTGDEFANKGYSNAEYVAVLYDTFFNREIAEGEGDFWVNALNSGTSRESVLSGFVNSEEFFALCAEYGILRGVMLEDGIAVNAGIGKFAERLYTEVLGREGEEGGMEFWATSISRGECTPKDAAMNFFTSTEYLAKNTTDEAYLEALYRTFMGRDSDEGGMNFWLSSMAAGTDDRTSALINFSASEEFKQIMASYGL